VNYRDMMDRMFFGVEDIAPRFQTTDRRIRRRIRPTKTKPMSAKAKKRAADRRWTMHGMTPGEWNPK